MSRDALDDKIEATRQEAADLRARLADAELRLSVYEEAARLRPAGAAQGTVAVRPAVVVRAEPSKRGGRKPGAISRKWQTILRGVTAHYPLGATPADIASFGDAAGLPNLKPKDARQQAEKYVSIGYMERVADDSYRVTTMACDRYGLRPLHAAPRFEVDHPESTTATDSQSAAVDELSSAERV